MTSIFPSHSDNQTRVQTRVAGIIGWPVSHTWSPLIHGYWLRLLKINGAYVPFPVAPERLQIAVPGLISAGVCGFNVTIPHKQQVVPLLDHLTDEAQRIGAVNTVIINHDGSSVGHNTDSSGFQEHLQAHYPQHALAQHTVAQHAVAERPAVVIGSGGAARAIVSALIDLGVSELRISSRNRSHAESMLADLDSRSQSSRVHESRAQSMISIDWSQREQALDESALVVNTTPLGMSGQPPLELSLEHLPLDAIVADAVYVPLITPLLREASRRGNPVLDGLGMLLHQAVPGFEAWFGTRPQVTAGLRDFVMQGDSIR